MNNKGQTAAIFVILIPIIFILLAFVYDNALIMVQNNRLENVTKSIGKDVLSNSYSDIVATTKELYDKNGYDTSLDVISYEEPYLKVYAVHKYNSFFGYIIGKKSYQSKVDARMYLDGDKLIYEDLSEVEGE